MVLGTPRGEGAYPSLLPHPRILLPQRGEGAGRRKGQVVRGPQAKGRAAWQLGLWPRAPGWNGCAVVSRQGSGKEDPTFSSSLCVKVTFHHPDKTRDLTCVYGRR